MKQLRSLVHYFLCTKLHNAVSSSQYPNSLKYADITPVFIKHEKIDKKNYHPVGI